MRLFLATVLVGTFVSAFGQVVDLKELKQMEVDRLRAMAEAGAVPRARLDQAQAELADAEDNAVLRRTLYGTLAIEDFTKDQSDAMLAAARRLVDRQQDRLERSKALVAEGVLPRASLTVLQEDLDFRRKALDLATLRAKLLDELSARIRAEEQIADGGPVVASGRTIERFDGKGYFVESEFIKIASAFQRQFAKPLPVSARGDTALHRSLGFDHRGRFDIALSPDQPEGVWLRRFLQTAKIPFYAFRAAVRGKATAPHIHIGPPSLRLRLAD